MSKPHELTAIIYDRKGKVLSVGKNSYVKTHPLQAKHAKKVGEPFKTVVHAEVAAIIKCRDLSKAHRIKIFRFDNQGAPALAAPCKICQSAIAASGIKYVEHT